MSVVPFIFVCLVSMTPKFFYTQNAIRELNSFRSCPTIYDFVSIWGETVTIYGEGNLETIVQLVELSIQRFSEEVNQVIYTNTPAAQRGYFEELKEDIKKLCLLDTRREYFLPLIDQYNDLKYQEYLQKLTPKIDAFLSADQRKYKHLERYTYKTWDIFSNSVALGTGLNYNFYCVEESPKLIDTAFLDRYLALLNALTDQFKSAYQTQMRLYDEGKIVSDRKDEDDIVDKFMKWVRRQKTLAALLILLAIYYGVSEFVHKTKENKEDLKVLFLEDTLRKVNRHSPAPQEKTDKIKNGPLSR